MSAQVAPAPSTPLCSEEEIRLLVETFYGRVRKDAELGPIFEKHVADWDAHFDMQADFWSALVLRTRRFKGAPLPRHVALPGLSWPLFERWLAIFHQTTADLGVPALKQIVDPMAQRVAAKLWEMYQTQANIPTPPFELPPGLVRYGESPVFTPENLPEKLKSAHTTKAGTWGVLRVHSGIVQYFVDEPPHAQAVVSSGKSVVIEPEVPHHVEFGVPGSFQVEFWRREG
ncbi:MAG: DUF1971 domain-containing protein [Alcaligenaceae bacterium]|nr:DUF1971 domain-containing protein [Alcaligenaceae bacterium]